MRLEKWALFAEVVSGVAVLITLVFLVVGVKENSDITRAAMYADVTAELNETERAIMSDRYLNGVYAAFMRRQTSNLTDEDFSLLQRIVSNMSRTYDMAYSMHDNGVLGDNEWGRYSRAACSIFDRAVDAGLDGQFLVVGSDGYQNFIRSCEPE